LPKYEKKQSGKMQNQEKVKYRLEGDVLVREFVKQKEYSTV